MEAPTHGVKINAPNLWRLETPGHSGWGRTARVDDPSSPGVARVSMGQAG